MTTKFKQSAWIISFWDSNTDRNNHHSWNHSSNYRFLYLCSKSSLTRLGLPRLLKIGGTKSSFWLLNLRFQLSIEVCKKEHCGYFDLKQLTIACVPLLYAYFSTSSSTRDGLLVLHLLYKELCLLYFLMRFPVQHLQSVYQQPWNFRLLWLILEYLPEILSSFFLLVKYERKFLVTITPLQQNVFFTRYITNIPFTILNAFVWTTYNFRMFIFKLSIEVGRVQFEDC